jgi:ribosomal protein S1
MDWTNKNVHPSKLVHLGQEVDVMILDIDQERRRISLGIKQCGANPWEKFSSTHNKGDHVTGSIKSITDFGIFIGLDGGIDGLVHLSDVSWNDDAETSIRNFNKGDEITTVVLAVDSERERISLGIKQLEQDPFSSYVSESIARTIVVISSPLLKLRIDVSASLFHETSDKCTKPSIPPSSPINIPKSVIDLIKPVTRSPLLCVDENFSHGFASHCLIPNEMRRRS